MHQVRPISVILDYLGRSLRPEDTFSFAKRRGEASVQGTRPESPDDVRVWKLCQGVDRLRQRAQATTLPELSSECLTTVLRRRAAPPRPRRGCCAYRAATHGMAICLASKTDQAPGLRRSPSRPTGSAIIRAIPGPSIRPQYESAAAAAPASKT